MVLSDIPEPVHEQFPHIPFTEAFLVGPNIFDSHRDDNEDYLLVGVQVLERALNSRHPNAFESLTDEYVEPNYSRELIDGSISRHEDWLVGQLPTELPGFLVRPELRPEYALKVAAHEQGANFIGAIATWEGAESEQLHTCTLLNPAVAYPAAQIFQKEHRKVAQRDQKSRGSAESEVIANTKFESSEQMLHYISAGLGAILQHQIKHFRVYQDQVARSKMPNAIFPTPPSPPRQHLQWVESES